MARRGNAPAPGAARRRLALRVAGTVLVLAVLLAFLPFDELVAAIQSLPVWAWPVALVAYLLFHFVGVTKWRLLINSGGADLRVRRAAQAYYWGLFGNLFLPSIVGGDLIRAGVALPHARSRTGLLLGSVVDRLQDVVGLGLLAGIGALFSPRALDEQSRRVFLGLLALLLTGAAVVVLVVLVFRARWIPFRHRRRLVHLRRAIRSTASRPGTLVRAFLLGLTLQVLFVLLNWRLGAAVGLNAPLYVWLFVWPLAKIAGLLPLTQGGIGVREAAQAALFAPFGVPAVLAVATGLVFEMVIVAGALASAGIAIVLRRGDAGRAVDRQGGLDYRGNTVRGGAPK